MPREGGRPCGCDPKEDYVCTGHAAHVDDKQTMITEDVFVSGPSTEGWFGISHGDNDHVWLKRFEVEDLIEELQRRLRARE